MSPFYLKKVMTLLVHLLKSDYLFSHRPTDYTVTTPTLSFFPADRLSSVLVNSAAKNRLSLGCYSLP